MAHVQGEIERREVFLHRDTLGSRVLVADEATGDLLQVLRIEPSFLAVPSFEFALRAGVARLARIQCASYPRVRRIERIHTAGPALAIVSEYVEGTRLSELLRVAEAHQIQVDISTALCLIRQLASAVARLHEIARSITNGLIAPERLVVTDCGRLVISDHVLGAAIEQLRLGPARLWRELRVPMLPHAVGSRFDQRLDVRSVGLVALALVLGRPLADHEFPEPLGALVDTARERSSLGYERPLSAPLRAWLFRALDLDPENSFPSAMEASRAIEQIVADETLYVTSPISLEVFLSRCAAVLLEPLAPDAVAAQPATHESAAVPPLVPDATRVCAPAAEPLAEPATICIPPVPVLPASVSDSLQTIEELLAVQPRPARAEGPAAARLEATAGESVAPQVIDWESLDRESSAIAAPGDIAALFSGEDLPFAPVEAAPIIDAWSPAPAAQVEVADTQVRRRTWQAAFTDRRIPWRAVTATAGVLLVGGSGLLALAQRPASAAATAPTGTLVVQSNPAGLPVLLNGVESGQTPARLMVAAGEHLLEVRGTGGPRTVPVTVSAGEETSHYLEVGGGANDREVAPRRLDGAPAAARSGRGDTSPRVVATEPPARSRGWLTVATPFPLEIHAAGRAIGTTSSGRMPLPAGRYELLLVNEAVGYRTGHVVEIIAGRTASLTVAPPNGTVHVNASPWAEVWIDGQRIGDTPLGNITLPIGNHELVLRHPQLGERRRMISVTLHAPVRVSVDMN